jgi:predicted transcriptional regulator
MKTLKSTFWLEARNLKSFFKTDMVKLYLLEIVFAVVLLALAILLAAILK